MNVSPDFTIAYADKLLYEAALTGFYGQLTFMFKAGTIVLVRKEETVIPSTATDEPTRREAREEEFQRADHRNVVQNRR